MKKQEIKSLKTAGALLNEGAYDSDRKLANGLKRAINGMKKNPESIKKASYSIGAAIVADVLNDCFDNPITKTLKVITTGVAVVNTIEAGSKVIKSALEDNPNREYTVEEIEQYANELLHED